MPLSADQKMKNTQKLREDLMKDRMNRDELDLRTARLEPPIARIPISYAASVSNKSVKPPQRDLLKELSKCRAEFAQLKSQFDSRSKMLSTAISVMEQNGIRIPAGAKKFKKTKKKKSMRMKPHGKSMKKPKSRGKTRRNMSKRSRR